MVGKSEKCTRLTLQEKLEALRMLESGSLPSAVMYKFWRFDVENDDDVRDAVVADIVDEMRRSRLKLLRKRPRMKWGLMK